MRKKTSTEQVTDSLFTLKKNYNILISEMSSVQVTKHEGRYSRHQRSQWPNIIMVINKNTLWKWTNITTAINENILRVSGINKKIGLMKQIREITITLSQSILMILRYINDHSDGKWKSHVA